MFYHACMFLHTCFQDLNRYALHAHTLHRFTYKEKAGLSTTISASYKHNVYISVCSAVQPDLGGSRRVTLSKDAYKLINLFINFFPNAHDLMVILVNVTYFVACRLDYNLYICGNIFYIFFIHIGKDCCCEKANIHFFSFS